MSSISVGLSDCTSRVYNRTFDLASSITNKVYSVVRAIFDRIFALYNFILPKNFFTGSRELWYLPVWAEKLIGNSLYSSTCASTGGVMHGSVYQERVEIILGNISQVAQRPDARFDYEIQILDSDEINAWALPGGKLAINRGLIEAVDGLDLSIREEVSHEDVLAAVIGHEIAHSAIGHTRKRIEKTLIVQVALLIGKVVADVFIGRAEERARSDKRVEELQGYRKLIKVAHNFFSRQAFKLYMLMNSRSAEYEADEYGIKFAFDAGYNVLGALDLQQLFIRNHPRPSGCLGKFKEWLSTHPNPQSRFEKNNVTINKIHRKKGAFRQVVELPQGNLIWQQE